MKRRSPGRLDVLEAEAQDAIREAAVADLARALERDPNSLIFGD
jgi:hypothetical protein